MVGFVKRVFSSFSSAFSAVFVMVRGLLIFLSAVLVVWFGAYVLHRIVPSTVVAQFSSDVAAYKDGFFLSLDRITGASNSLDRSSMQIFSSDTLNSGANQWVEVCYEGGGASIGLIDKPSLSYGLTPRTLKLIGSIRDQSDVMYERLHGDRGTLFSLREKSGWFAAILIAIGMVTTIVSALNSSEFGNGSSYSASMIKVLAIILPALGTALTAYAALYASPDQVSRKSQIVFNLMALQSEMDGIFIQAPCPLVGEEQISRYEKYVADWGRRFSEIVSNADYSQGVSKDANQGRQANPGEGESKANAASGGQ
nr:hypothetical protein [uncultured Shinella sp.]